MQSLLFRGRPDENNECDQWSLVREIDDEQLFVVQERVRLEAVLAGKPYLRLVRRMTADEFLSTDQPQAVKRMLRAALHPRSCRRLKPFLEPALGSIAIKPPQTDSDTCLSRGLA